MTGQSLFGTGNEDSVYSVNDTHNLICRVLCSVSDIFKSYSPPQRLEGNESPVFVDISGCFVAVALRNFYSEVEGNFSRSFPLLFPQFFLTQSLCEGEYVRVISFCQRLNSSPSTKVATVKKS